MDQKPAKVAPATKPDVVAAALRDCLRTSWMVVLFSGAVNVLTLAGPLYMLQVYDRVLGSRSVPTLVALTLVLFGAYAFFGAFDQFVPGSSCVRSSCSTGTLVLTCTARWFASRC